MTSIVLALQPDDARLVETVLRSQLGQVHVLLAIVLPGHDLYEEVQELDARLTRVCEAINRELAFTEDKER